MCGCNKRQSAAKAGRIMVTWPNEIDPTTNKPKQRTYLTQVEARTAMNLRPGGVKVVAK